jgi:benzoyl-CoA reductase/2-hydroxyglutaryl-CoA dehydratase subunit BcrC/BadD/HgdB
MLNRLLTGAYDFLDFLVIPHARDTIRRLYVLMVELKASLPELKLPELHFLDVLHTPFFSSSVYNRLQKLDFKKVLEQWSGREITNESIAQAIAITNENKMLLKKVAELRASDPCRISGVEALQLIGSSMFMLKEDHNKVLQQYLTEAAEQSCSDRVRVFVAGSPLDNLQLYEILASAGVMVVAEDNCWGNRYSDIPIDTTLEPLEAVIDRYHNKSPCNRMYPMSRRIDYCVQNAIAARAQGVIFNTYRNDGAEALETPAKRKALAERGIPSLYLKNQPYLINEPEKIKIGVSEFVKEIKGN